jgi:type II secretory pathway predicted ATPase ExeA
MLDQLMKPPADAPVKTRTALKLRAAVEMATAHHAIVTAEGPVGIGKSTALRDEMERLRAEGRNAALVTATADNGGRIKEIYNAAIGAVRGYFCAGNRDARNTFIEMLTDREACGVLLIDEAQNLKPQVLEGLRGAHDEHAHAGMNFAIVLCGNPHFVDRYGRGRNSNFAQLESRIFHRFMLHAPSEDELRMVLSAQGGAIEDDARDALLSYAVERGSFRALVQVHRKARARAGDRPITLRQVMASIRGKECAQ